MKTLKTWVTEIKFNGQKIVTTLDEVNNKAQALEAIIDYIVSNIEIEIYDPLDVIIGNCEYFTPDNVKTYILTRD